MQLEAVRAISSGARGVHITGNDGKVHEAIGIKPVGTTLFVETRCLNGEDGPTLLAAHCWALERDYEATGDA